MTHYFLPRHLGITEKPKKKLKRIASRSNRPSAVQRRKLYAEAVATRRAMVIAKQVGMTEEQARLYKGPVHCEFCWDRYNTVHVYRDPHHIAGRRGDNMYDPHKLRLICRRVHNRAHADPKWAEKVGLRLPH